MPGPVPKPSTERRRRNAPTGAKPVRARGAAVVALPEVNPTWHPVARDWFESLKTSGQAAFYEPSDWATAVYVAHAMSTNLEQGKRFSSMLFSAVMGGMTELLTTEGARRRARIELERSGEVEEPASVAIMARYRRAADRAG